MTDRYITKGEIKKQGNNWVLVLTRSVKQDDGSVILDGTQPDPIILDELVINEGPTWYPNNNA